MTLTVPEKYGGPMSETSLRNPIPGSGNEYPGLRSVCSLRPTLTHNSDIGVDATYRTFSPRSQPSVTSHLLSPPSHPLTPPVYGSTFPCRY